MEQSSTKHLTMANNIEAFTKKNQKENLNDAKMHNFTECCRWVTLIYCNIDSYLLGAKKLYINFLFQEQNVQVISVFFPFQKLAYMYCSIIQYEIIWSPFSL